MQIEIGQVTMATTHYREGPSALVAAKIDLYRAMREQRVSKADLGRRLRWHPPQVDRLLEVHHVSQLD